MSARHAAFVVAASCLLGAFAVLAQEVCPNFRPVIPPSASPMPAGSPPHATADQAQVDETGNTVLIGGVRVEEPERTLESETVEYDRKTGDVRSPGALRYQDENLGIRATQGQYNVNTKAGRFGETEYTFTRVRGRGKAEEIVTEQNKVAEMRGIQYTTCNPNDSDWVLSASKLTIDKDAQTGTARNALLRFKKIPILYAPYFSFPVGVDRKTGFLFPSAGNSSKSGFYASAPYYVNIAPDKDATLTPGFLGDRGAQLGAEFRYLNSASEGSMDGNVLPHDNETGKERDHVYWKHDGLLTSRWDYGVDYEHVSDDRYVNDLSSSLGALSRTHLEQSAHLDYQTPDAWFTMRALAQAFQTVDPTLPATDRPYRRLPMVQMDLRTPRARTFQGGLDTEVVRFSRNIGDEGNRVDAHPFIGVDLDRTSWFLNTRAGYHYTAYDLRHRAAGLDESPTRSLPVFTLNTGLRFERISDASHVQTLEPRLYYLYVPFRKQDDLPLFDTTLPDFETGELFSANRFVGLDRIGDANQVTAALDSHWINTGSGKADVRGTIGQIYYLESPRVAIPGTPTLDPEHSDILAATDFRFAHNWRTALSGQWDADSDRFNRGSARVLFRGDEGGMLSAAYRFRRALLEQTDLVFIWPAIKHWNLIGRWTYSLEDDRGVEQLAGIEYSACCWAIRTSWRRYVSSSPDKFDSAVSLQLELTGLGNLGTSVTDEIDRSFAMY